MYTRELKITIVVLGKISTGKTTLISAFKGKSPEDLQSGEKPESTIGAIYGIQDVPAEFLGIELLYSGSVRLCIWDTTGNEKYSSILPSYVRKAAVILLCFCDNDMIDLKKRIETIRTETDAPIFLVATKRDSIGASAEAPMDLSEIKKFFGDSGSEVVGTNFPVYETSSYTGMGVLEIFQAASRKGYYYEFSKALQNGDSIVELVKRPDPKRNRNELPHEAGWCC